MMVAVYVVGVGSVDGVGFYDGDDDAIGDAEVDAFYTFCPVPLPSNIFH